ncbi:MAG: hypothetical protein BWY22_00616 [Bacteroidetes bacterium ADurb.Bin217]|nr:MAG: hypothetical protein BWY22_00616 [Bacteroidetes bacterium ADurb.Bin217]
MKYNIGEQLNESNFQDLTAYMYQKINNKPLHATMSKAGKILEVKNLDSIIDTLVEENKHVPKESKEYAKKWLVESHFNPKRMNDNLILVYPEYPVSNGDTWTIFAEFESGNPSKMSTVYEIIEITSDFAIIKSSTKFERIDVNTIENYFSMQIKFNVTVTSITEMKVDLHTGWIIDAKIYSEQNGVMYLKNSSKDTKIEKLPYCVLKEVAITN